MGCVHKRNVGTAGEDAAQRRTKKLRTNYEDNYHNLFNDTATECIAPKFQDKHGPLLAGQLGVSQWSFKEKEAFFMALKTRGRHAFAKISSDIGTKSESEVHVYVQMLQKAAAKQELHAMHRHRLFNKSSVAAALEVSNKCCAALDIAADILIALDQRNEEKLAKKNHPQHWLLTTSTAKWADRCMELGEDRGEVRNVLPAAELLNLGRFLQLSKRFFMNSGVMSNNYRAYTERRKKVPTIMYTAFSDIHTLAISVTKRLIQSAIFISLSRLKAERSYSAPSRSVKRADVLAALDILQMKRDANVFWIGMARRHQLIVHDRPGGQYDTEMAYDEVEKSLNAEDPRRHYQVDQIETDENHNSGNTSQNTQRNQGSYESYSSSSGFMEDDSDSNSSPNSLPTLEAQSSETDAESLASHTPNSKPSPSPSKRQDREAHEQLHDDYLEALDQKASQEEEHRLWEILGKTEEDKVDLAEFDVLKAPLPPARAKEDLVDWRDWTAYGGEWEMLPMLPLNSSLFEGRRTSHRRTMLSLSGDRSHVTTIESIDEDEVEKDSDEQEPGLSASGSAVSDQNDQSESDEQINKRMNER